MNRDTSILRAFFGWAAFAAGVAACSGGGPGPLLGGDGGLGALPGEGELPTTTKADAGRDAGKRRDAGSTDDTTDDPPADAGRRKDGGPTYYDAGDYDASYYPYDAGLAGESCSLYDNCSGGGTMNVCTTRDGSGNCTAMRYKVNGSSFYCNSCTDCTTAYNNASNACFPPTVYDAGSPVESCSSAGVSCTNGYTMQLCTTSSSSSGSCLSQRYTVGSQSFSCSACSSCTSAYNSAYAACQPSTTNTACDDLEQYCCNSSYFPASSKSSCLSTASYYRTASGGNAQCQSLYTSYSNSGYCD